MIEIKHKNIIDLVKSQSGIDLIFDFYRKYNKKPLIIEQSYSPTRIIIKYYTISILIKDDVIYLTGCEDDYLEELNEYMLDFPNIMFGEMTTKDKLITLLKR